MDAAVLLSLPALVGLAGLARLFLRQDSLVFRPSRPLDRTPADYALPYEDLRLVAGDGSGTSGWWIPSPPSRQVVIFFHGSEGNLAHALPTARFLHSLGVNALLVEYPGYGADASRRPSEDGCYQAADAAWELVVEQRSFAPGQVILFGFSIGTAVATYLAARRTCAGLVLHSGFTSVPDLAARSYPWLPVRPFCRTKMNSLERIRQSRAPLLMLHSRDDDHIPIDHARRLYRRAPGRKRFVTLCGAHGGGSWPHQDGVLEAWRQLLTRQTASWEVGRGVDASA